MGPRPLTFAEGGVVAEQEVCPAVSTYCDFRWGTHVCESDGQEPQTWQGLSSLPPTQLWAYSPQESLQAAQESEMVEKLRH